MLRGLSSFNSSSVSAKERSGLASLRWGRIFSTTSLRATASLSLPLAAFGESQQSFFSAVEIGQCQFGIDHINIIWGLIVPST